MKPIKQTSTHLDTETIAMSSDSTYTRLSLPRRAILLNGLRKLLLMVMGLFIFIIALQLLKKGAGIYGQQITQFLSISNPTNSLGFGWLLAYVFLSGSPVAAVAISFFASGTITILQTFTMITGSRLGASFIVLLVGFIYYLRGQRHTASISTGVLALLTTAAIYLPALAIGYFLLTSNIVGVMQVQATAPLHSWLDTIIDPVVDMLTRLLPGWILLPTGVMTLLFAFNVLDRALPEIDSERNAFSRIGQLIYRPMAMFLLGALVTSVTLSVSVSLSILVPLSIRGLVRRENTLPYIMGANITTFIDTLVAALIVGGPAAFSIVLVEMVSVAALSLLVLLFCYRQFESIILRIQEWIVQTRWTLTLFLGTMLLIPLFLLLVP